MARRLEHVREDGHLLAAAQRRGREELRLELADDDPGGVAIGARHVRGDRTPRQRVEQSTRENRGAHALAQFHEREFRLFEKIANFDHRRVNQLLSRHKCNIYRIYVTCKFMRRDSDLRIK